MTEPDFLAMGYDCVRMLQSGEMAGTHQMITTGALIVGLDESGYRTRFCYRTLREAEDALIAWDGYGDPPGNWIKEKGAIERHGPGSKF